MLPKRIFTSSAVPARIQLGAVLLLLLLFGPVVHGQYLTSPCPSIFQYRWDAATQQVYGFVQLYNLRIGQVVRLNVDLSIGFQVPQYHVGSITLVKSKEQTFRDINNNLPAEYRVNFPFRNAFPNLLEIRVNGNPVCYGRRATGRVVTTIKLDHTLVTQLQTPAVQQAPRPVVYAPPVQQTARPIIYTPPVQQTPRPIIYTPPVQQTPRPIIYTPPVQQTPRPIIYEPTIQYQPEPEPQPLFVGSRLPIDQTESQVVQTPRLQPQSQDVCGKPSPKFSQLSINGKLSPKGQFPWAVPIFETRSSTKPKYICGSTILNKYHLVTAGHCMFDDGRKLRPSDLLTTPGMYNIDNFFESDIQERDVASIIIHPDYDDYETTMNDIALMVLQQAIVYNDLVRPICLWNGNDNIDDIIGRKGLVSGWGITEHGSAKRPSYVQAKVISKSQCRRKMGSSFSPDKRTFCGDGQGEIPCSGDSGSGLVFNEGSQFYIRGVVSVGQLDPFTLLCDATKYVLYTDITHFRSWLLKEML